MFGILLIKQRLRKHIAIVFQNVRELFIDLLIDESYCLELGVHQLLEGIANKWSSFIQNQLNQIMKLCDR
jgi:hypothetical protein